MICKNKFGFENVISSGKGICILTTIVLNMLSLCFDKINFNSNYKTTLFENYEKVRSFANNIGINPIELVRSQNRIHLEIVFLLKMFYSLFYVNFVLKITWNTFIVNKHIPFGVYPIRLAKPHNHIHLGIMFFLKIILKFLE